MASEVDLVLVGLWQCPKCKSVNATSLAVAEMTQEETEEFAELTDCPKEFFRTGEGLYSPGDSVECAQCESEFDVGDMRMG